MEASAPEQEGAERGPEASPAMAEPSFCKHRPPGLPTGRRTEKGYCGLPIPRPSPGASGLTPRCRVGAGVPVGVAVCYPQSPAVRSSPAAPPHRGRRDLPSSVIGGPHLPESLPQQEAPSCLQPQS